MKRSGMSYQLVELIPERLEEGVLYISQRYGTAAHKCCCGCGEEVITPLNPTDWSVLIEKGVATLHPSIGNWSFACQSHYWIRQGRVVWAEQMSQYQIERGRLIDRAAKQAYFDDINRNKGQLSGAQHGHSTPQGLFYGLWLAFRQWLNK